MPFIYDIYKNYVIEIYYKYKYKVLLIQDSNAFFLINLWVQKKDMKMIVLGK